MRKSLSLILLTLIIAAAVPALAGERAAKAPLTKAEKLAADEQVRGLEAMCEANADARSARHAKKSLYERLGKEKGIHALTREVVRLHLINDSIKHLVDENYKDLLAQRVAEFMISGMGGPPVYEGPSLAYSHARLKLTNADFMAAGSDVMTAMKNLGHGQEEIDEVVCALVGLIDQVVLAD